MRIDAVESKQASNVGLASVFWASVTIRTFRSVGVRVLTDRSEVNFASRRGLRRQTHCHAAYRAVPNEIQCQA